MTWKGKTIEMVRVKIESIFHTVYVTHQYRDPGPYFLGCEFQMLACPIFTSVVRFDQEILQRRNWYPQESAKDRESDQKERINTRDTAEKEEEVFLSGTVSSLRSL